MKTTLIKWERERVFPVDPCPNRFGSLSITEILCKLHNANQDQPPGRHCGLPDFCIDTRKESIIIDIPQFITHLHADISGRKCSLCYRGGFWRNPRNTASLETHCCFILFLLWKVLVGTNARVFAGVPVDDLTDAVRHALSSFPYPRL